MNKKMLVLLSTLIISSTLFAEDKPQCPFGNGPMRQQEMRRGPGAQNGGGILMQLDVNKDGKVTKDEVTTWFDKIDKNKDGVLTKEELQSVRPTFVGPPQGKQGGRGKIGQGPRGNGPGKRGNGPGPRWNQMENSRQ